MSPNTCKPSVGPYNAPRAWAAPPLPLRLLPTEFMMVLYSCPYSLR
jgi:hypothetical protein